VLGRRFDERLAHVKGRIMDRIVADYMAAGAAGQGAAAGLAAGAGGGSGSSGGGGGPFGFTSGGGGVQALAAAAAVQGAVTALAAAAAGEAVAGHASAADLAVRGAAAVAATTPAAGVAALALAPLGRTSSCHVEGDELLAAADAAAGDLAAGGGPAGRRGSQGSSDGGAEGSGCGALPPPPQRAAAMAAASSCAALPGARQGACTTPAAAAAASCEPELANMSGGQAPQDAAAAQPSPGGSSASAGRVLSSDELLADAAGPGEEAADADLDGWRRWALGGHLASQLGSEPAGFQRQGSGQRRSAEKPAGGLPGTRRWLYSTEGLPQEFVSWIRGQEQGGGSPVAFLDHAWGAISPQVCRWRCPCQGCCCCTTTVQHGAPWLQLQLYAAMSSSWCRPWRCPPQVQYPALRRLAALQQLGNPSWDVLFGDVMPAAAGHIRAMLGLPFGAEEVRPVLPPLPPCRPGCISSLRCTAAGRWAWGLSVQQRGCLVGLICCWLARRR
jgi:hypothetical protein